MFVGVFSSSLVDTVEWDGGLEQELWADDSGPWPVTPLPWAAVLESNSRQSSRRSSTFPCLSMVLWLNGKLCVLLQSLSHFKA
jgi:hypothetical protein